MKDNSSKQILLSVLGVAILVVAVVGVSFAAFTFSQAGTVENTISTGTLSMTYSEGSTGITITDAMPMSDEAGKVLNGENQTFKFSVGASISGTATINYEIAAIKKETSTLADSDVRLYLEKGTSADGPFSEAFAPAQFTPLGSATALGSPQGSMVLESGTFSTTSTNYYVLRMWVKEDAVITGTAQTYTVTVNVYGQA